MAVNLASSAECAVCVHRPAMSLTARPRDLWAPATAVFSISNGMIDVTLTNLQRNPRDVGQLFGDLFFTLGGGGSLTDASLSSSFGQEITVNRNGSFTLGATVSTGWASGMSGTTSALLDVLPTSTAPTHFISAPPRPGATYSNANGGIAGNVPHNPFLNDFATFSITGPGITSAQPLRRLLSPLEPLQGLRLKVPRSQNLAHSSCWVWVRWDLWV